MTKLFYVRYVFSRLRMCVMHVCLCMLCIYAMRLGYDRMLCMCGPYACYVCMCVLYACYATPFVSVCMRICACAMYVM